MGQSSQRKKSIADLEIKKIKKLSVVAKNLDSPDPQTMYSAGHSLVELGMTRSLLPKAMVLLYAEDVLIISSIFHHFF